MYLYDCNLARYKIGRISEIQGTALRRVRWRVKICLILYLRFLFSHVSLIVETQIELRLPHYQYGQAVRLWVMYVERWQVEPFASRT